MCCRKKNAAAGTVAGSSRKRTCHESTGSTFINSSSSSRRAGQCLPEAEFSFSSSPDRIEDDIAKFAFTGPFTAVF